MPDSFRLIKNYQQGDFTMNFKQIGLKVLVVTVIAAIIAGCSTPPTATLAPTAITETEPTVNVQPTLNMVKTQAAQTVVANLTQNAPKATPITPTTTNTSTPAVTATLALTNTPVPPTARPTATYIPWTATPIYTATSVAYSCSITEVSPKATDTIKVGVDFDGRWVVKNTGTQTWLKADVDIKYLSGTKFQTKGDLFDMMSDVVKDASYTVIVDMKAPADAGTYNASWALVLGGQSFCTMNLTVVVIK
jgi:hypothetical protein